MLLMIIVIKLHAKILVSHPLCILICLNQPKQQKILMQNFVSLELTPSRVRHQKLKFHHLKVCRILLMWPVTD